MPDLTNPSEVVLALAADERYAMPLAVTLKSALETLEPQRPIRILIIDGGMGERSKVRLRRVAGDTRPDAVIEWHDSDPSQFADAKVSAWGSSANYLRLLIPQLVGQETDRVIYLDGDVIVRRDLAELWDLCQQDSSAPIFAVRNYTYSDAISAFGEEGVRHLGLNPRAWYFNSGVLVINVPVWLDGRITDLTRDTAVNHKSHMRFSDQDALNIVLSERWTCIDDRWNVMLNYLNRYTTGDPETDPSRRYELRAQAHIVHYGGSSKPWIPGYNGLGGRAYRAYLYRSGWFDSKAEQTMWSIRYWLHTNWVVPRLKSRLARRFPRLTRAARTVSRSRPPTESTRGEERPSQLSSDRERL